MSVCRELVTLIGKALPQILNLRDRVRVKADGSYVSDGDLLVQSLVMEHLAAALPAHQLISEELAPFDGVAWNAGGSYVVLDPIDGTENFVSGLKEWGVGICVYTAGRHLESCIYLPELDDCLVTGQPLRRFRSRIIGLSSSLTRADLETLPWSQAEFRIIGCSMYNMLAAVKGAYRSFENVKGVNCWDILPGLNLALEHGCQVWVDQQPYTGELLFPTRKYRIRIDNAPQP